MAILKFTAKEKMIFAKLNEGDSFTITLPQPHSRPNNDEIIEAIESQLGVKPNCFLSYVNFNVEVIKR